MWTGGVPPVAGSRDESIGGSGAGVKIQALRRILVTPMEAEHPPKDVLCPGLIVLGKAAYRVIESVQGGIGGVGRTFLVDRASDGARFVAKELYRRRFPHADERFLREIEIHRNLNHPHVSDSRTW